MDTLPYAFATLKQLQALRPGETIRERRGARFEEAEFDGVPLPLGAEYRNRSRTTNTDYQARVRRLESVSAQVDEWLASLGM